jgi:hypothetical protein
MGLEVQVATLGALVQVQVLDCSHAAHAPREL